VGTGRRRPKSRVDSDKQQPDAETGQIGDRLVAERFEFLAHHGLRYQDRTLVGAIRMGTG
jgi:hypothetical protein